MNTWTLEHAKAIVAAWPNVQMHLRENHWVTPKLGLAAYPTEQLGDPGKFRLPPKKRLGEWTASDVKPGMVFRHRDWSNRFWTSGITVTLEGIWIGIFVSWNDLMVYWQWSLDASPGSWRPCANEVEG